MDIVASELEKRHSTIKVQYDLKGNKHDVHFRNLSGGDLACTNEAVIAGGLLPCMRTGAQTIRVEGPVSAAFMAGLSTIQDIFRCWDDTFQRVDIEADEVVNYSGNPKNRVGTFFSGGVDSFYTLVKHREEITDLIFMHGMDIRLHNEYLRKETSDSIHKIAEAFGMQVTEIETNLRTLLDSHVRWNTYGHGAFIAATGHLLSHKLNKIYIPASHTYADMHPCGTHPVLDHLWGTETLEFVHDGCEATRVEKVARISEYDVVLEHLRVCWQNVDGTYNCGICEKCIRTMINLKVNGVLERSRSFNVKTDIHAYLKQAKVTKYNREFFVENYKALKKNGTDPELETVLENLLKPPTFLQKIGKRVRKRFRRLLR